MTSVPVGGELREKLRDFIWEATENTGVRTRIFKSDCDLLTDAVLASGLVVAVEDVERAAVEAERVADTTDGWWNPRDVASDLRRLVSRG